MSIIIFIILLLACFLITRLIYKKQKHVIVIGSGLAGLSAAIEAHSRGAIVTIVEKETTMGGNSIKASSGINIVSDR